MTGLQFVASTVQVSGYPPLPAQAVLCNGGTFVARIAGTTADAAAAIRASMLLGPVYFPRTLTHGHCGRCNQNLPRAAFVPRAGFPPYCGGCLDALAAACVARHGRTPGPGEWCCPKCLGILDETLRVHQSGRVRWCCVPCRRRQQRGNGG